MKLQSLILAGLAIAGTACTETAAFPRPGEIVINDTPVESKIMSPHLITMTSNASFEATITKLRGGIAARPLKLFAEIDHASGAATADLSLEPSTVFIFGNPKGGTPLMKRNPQMGIVLPLKMHVYQEDDKVFISYPDITVIAQNYGLDPNAQPVPNIGAMLKGLAKEIAN